MTLKTRLTEKFNLKWPIISAPMANVAGGNLASAVHRGGGLGLIGGGYGEKEFCERAWKDAGNTPAGIGFITWSLTNNPSLLEGAISHKPSAIMLSFGDVSSFSKKIGSAGISLICQCQTMGSVKHALDNGASLIVAQGTEAGGHGGSRATLPFVPEVADYLANHSPQTLLVAAGGIADGRGLAASLMLGADGVLIGTRYWATKQALVPTQFQTAGLGYDGDKTIRTDIPDIARSKNWPEGFKIRVANNELMQEFHGRSADLQPDELDNLTERYISAASSGNASNGGIIVGEAIGMINDLPDAEKLTEEIGAQAETLLKSYLPK